MKANQFTITDKKGPRYISGLLLIKGIRQDVIAKDKGVSTALVSQVCAQKRGGTRKPGPKVEIIQQAVADALGMPKTELFPDAKKAA